MNKFIISFIIVSFLSFATSQYLNYACAYIPNKNCSPTNCYKNMSQEKYVFPKMNMLNIVKYQQ